MNNIKSTEDSNESNTSLFAGSLVGIGLTGIALTGLVFSRYRTSKANKWLVRTGLGVNDIQIGIKFIQWPFQNIDYINMNPQHQNSQLKIFLQEEQILKMKLLKKFKNTLINLV